MVLGVQVSKIGVNNMTVREMAAKARAYDEMSEFLDKAVELLEYALMIIHPKRIIRSGPATIVVWEDGSKTIVKLKDGENDDLHSAFCAAVAKKVYGSNSKIKSMIKDTEIVDQRKA